ncbi:MAG TPA: hypothetical protein VF600_12790 [Abditibacteriaceae bacterium]|jgi:hypothetical protein
MGDFHFIVRHALTGIVLLGFSLCGLWMIDPNLALTAFKFVFATKDVSFGSALLATPVLGVIVQGVYTAFLYRFGDAFTDSARIQIGERIKNEVLARPITGMKEDVRQAYCDAFTSMPDDSPFVWLYHSEAPPHMVEWARRRRSYHYLGMNWAIAAALGLAVGVFLPLLLDAPYWLQRGLVAVFAIAWIMGTSWLAKKMKQDVDCMELVWACSHLYPEFKSRISNSPPDLLLNERR